MALAFWFIMEILINLINLKLSFFWQIMIFVFVFSFLSGVKFHVKSIVQNIKYQFINGHYLY